GDDNNEESNKGDDEANMKGDNESSKESNDEANKEGDKKDDENGNKGDKEGNKEDNNEDSNKDNKEGNKEDDNEDSNKDDKDKEDDEGDEASITQDSNFDKIEINPAKKIAILKNNRGEIVLEPINPIKIRKAVISTKLPNFEREILTGNKLKVSKQYHELLAFE
ncbi:16033_t:CDS:2, partial [Dentiscutata heterogama]